MNGGITKARTRRSRSTPSKAVQAKLLDAAADTSVELSRSHRWQSPVNEGLTQDAAPVPTAKRQLDATPESDPLPAKRARLTRTDARQPGVEKVEQTDKVCGRSLTQASDEQGVVQAALQQPEPRPPKRLYASFLGDFVDPVHPHPRPESLYTFVSGWLESVGSDREKRCRSDSHLYRSDDDPVPRQLAKSAPVMGYTRDADGFALPPTPASTGSRSYRADADTGSVARSDVPSSSRSGRSLVEDPHYRDLNLAANNIYMRNPDEEFPEHIANLVRHVGKDRDSPGPSPDQVRCDADLYQLEMEGVDEPGVESYFSAHTFPRPGASDRLKHSRRQPMAKYTVPNTGSNLRASNPVPDMLYGYNRHIAFPQQRAQLISMGTQPMANTEGLVYPFFVIEFKGNGGDLWVATNQCLGGSMSCVNMAELLNEQLRKCKSDKIQAIGNAAFSIAMNGTEARLYISWKHNELDYYMRKVKSFLLQEPEHYIEFRKYVRNIIDWGGDGRLNEIQYSLDSLLEESRKRASDEAKSRPPPSDGSVASGKKQKSSSRRNSSRSDNSQAQTRAADGPYQRSDETTSQDTRGAQPPRPHQQSFFDADDYTSQDAGEHGHRSSSHRNKNHGSARPSYAPTPPRLSEEHRESTRSSPSLDDSANSKSKEKSYWQQDARSGRLFHRHSDGRITWAEDDRY